MDRETGTGRTCGPVTQGQKLDFPGLILGLGTPFLNRTRPLIFNLTAPLATLEPPFSMLSAGPAAGHLHYHEKHPSCDSELLPRPPVLHARLCLPLCTEPVSPNSNHLPVVHLKQFNEQPL